MGVLVDDIFTIPTSTGEVVWDIPGLKYPRAARFLGTYDTDETSSSAVDHLANVLS